MNQDITVRPCGDQALMVLFEQRISEEIHQRVIREGKVQAVDGTDTAVQADSVCVHGDGKKALLFTRRIREALLAENIRIQASPSEATDASFSGPPASPDIRNSSFGR